MKHQVILQKMVFIFAEIESEREEDVGPNAMKALANLNRAFKQLLQEWADQHGYRLEYPSSRLGGLCSENKE